MCLKSSFAFPIIAVVESVVIVVVGSIIGKETGVSGISAMGSTVLLFFV